MHAVAADGFQQIHHGFAVAPGVHEQGIKTAFMGSHTQPQQVAVDAFQFSDQARGWPGRAAER